jgi:putative copper export protein/mono/diheme cytochrome c family protein
VSGLVIVRALHLAFCALALGIPAVLSLSMLSSRADRAPRAGEPFPVLIRLIGFALVAVGVELVSGALWLLLEAAEISESVIQQALTPQVLRSVLLQTRFGEVLLIRFGLTLAVGLCLVALLAARHRRTPIPMLCLTTAFAGSGFATLAWSGHAAATPGSLHLLADAVHLLAAGLWLGGLVALVGLFGAVMRSPDTASLTWLGTATRRFSLLGLACVGSLIITGSINGWFLVGTIPALVGTPYGQLLMVKLGLFGAMVGLAAINRYRLMPHLDDVGRTESPAAPLRAIRWLRRNAAAEAGLGLMILVIVSELGTVPPALHDQPWWPFAWRFSAVAMQLPAQRNEIIFALAMVGCSIAIILFGMQRPQHRLLTIGVGLGIVACCSPLLARLAVPAYPTSFLISPMGYTTQSIARGSRLFAENCVSCHGASGRGDGPIAQRLAVPPANLAAAHVLGHTEGDLFWFVTAGIGTGMPGFAATLDEAERWDLVNWVQTLPVGGLDEGLLDEVGGSAPRAPDFDFEFADGASDTLLNLARSGPVLLVLFTPSASARRLQRLAAAEATLEAAGLRILALPLDDRDASPETPFPNFVARSDASVALAYRVLADAPGYPSARPQRHLEFLIDTNGYARAVWAPESTIAWNEVSSLLELVHELATRPLAPVAVGHQHGMGGSP